MSDTASTNTMLSRIWARWVRQLARPNTARMGVGLASAPAFFALAIFGLAHDRWIIAVTLQMFLVVVVVFRVTMERKPWHVLVAAIVGALVGALSLIQGNPPPNSLPPGAIEPLCGAAACLSCLTLATRRYTYSWTFAWLLAALCLHVAPNPSMGLLLLLLLFSTFLCGTGLTNECVQTPIGMFWWMCTLLIVILLTLLLSGLALRSERLATSMGIDYLNRLNTLTGVGLDSTVNLAVNSTVGVTERIVLELSGRQPGYLRTNAMDEFDGFTWTTRNADQHAVATPAPAPDARTGKLSVLFIEPLETVIPAPAGTFAVQGAPAREFATWVWRAAKTPVGPEIELDRDLADDLPREDDHAAKADTVLPVVGELGNLRDMFRPMALDIVKDAHTPREMAERVELFFRANFYYSLHSDLRSKGYPLEVLIRERRPAYCTYFASAMAVLLRSLDVPARIATGFAPWETNPVDGRTLVRTRDAHAWVEVYLASEGRYVRFDPTPARTLDPMLAHAQIGWIGGAFRAVFSVLRRGWITFKTDPFGTIARIARSPYVAVPGFFLLLWMLWQRRGTATRRTRASIWTDDRQLRDIYRQYLRSLDRAGIVADPAETDEELIAKLSALRGSRAGIAARSFIDAYRRARYGGISSGDLGVLLDAAGQAALKSES